MPAVNVDLTRALGALAPDDFRPRRWLKLPASVQTMQAFECLLQSYYGPYCQQGPMEFLRAGGAVDDTVGLIGDNVMIEVVVGGESPATTAGQSLVGGGSERRQNSATINKRAGLSGGSEAVPQNDNSVSQRGANSEAPDGADITPKGAEGEKWKWREQPPLQHLSYPERMKGMEEMTEEERAQIRADGVPEEAMEDGELLPAMQRLGGHGPPAEVGQPRRCWHCSVLKSRIGYFPYMWSRQEHQPCVCRWCETHLTCSCCRKAKRPRAFSKKQARRWDGPRRCKQCIEKADRVAESGRRVAGGGAGPQKPTPEKIRIPKPRANPNRPAGLEEVEGCAAENEVESAAAEEEEVQDAAKESQGTAEEEETEQSTVESEGEEHSAEEEEAEQSADEEEAEQSADEHQEAEQIAAEEEEAELGVAEGAGVEAAEGEEDEAEIEEADREFGQPHVQETSLEAGPTWAEIVEAEKKAEEEEVEMRRQFQESGGVSAGQTLVVQDSDDGCSVVHARKTDGTDQRCRLKIGSRAVAQQDWHPSTGGDVVVAGAADGHSYLMGAKKGTRLPGVWAVSPGSLTRPFGAGAVGFVYEGEDSDTQEGEQGKVQAFHWPGGVHLNKWQEDGVHWYKCEGRLGRMPVGRMVRVVAVEELARYSTVCWSHTDMLSVEDVMEQEFGLETDFDADLECDRERSSDREEATVFGAVDAGVSTGVGKEGNGCVVEMDYCSGDSVDVRRSSVWIPVDTWRSASLREWTSGD